LFSVNFVILILTYYQKLNSRKTQILALKADKITSSRNEFARCRKAESCAAKGTTLRPWSTSRDRSGNVNKRNTLGLLEVMPLRPKEESCQLDC